MKEQAMNDATEFQAVKAAVSAFGNLDSDTLVQAMVLASLCTNRCDGEGGKTMTEADLQVIAEWAVDLTQQAAILANVLSLTLAPSVVGGEVAFRMADTQQAKDEIARLGLAVKGGGDHA